MRIIEVVVAVICISIFSLSLDTHVVGLYKTIKETSLLQEQLNRDLFISESFKNICRNNSTPVGDLHFDVWKQMCTSMWSLQEIYVTYENEDLGQPVVAPESLQPAKGRLCKAFWRSEDSSCFVLCREIIK